MMERERMTGGQAEEMKGEGEEKEEEEEMGGKEEVEILAEEERGWEKGKVVMEKGGKSAGVWVMGHGGEEEEAVTEETEVNGKKEMVGKDRERLETRE